MARAHVTLLINTAQAAVIETNNMTHAKTVTRSTSYVMTIIFAFVLPSGCRKTAPTTPQVLPVVKTPTGEMVGLAAGVFMMGSRQGEKDELPVHWVRLDAFFIDKCEVTQKQFGKLMNKDTSHFKGLTHPVEMVTWADAALYANARSRAESLMPCYDEDTGACDFSANGYRLPTEAEWEYACRAGATAEYPFGNDPRLLKRYGWFKDNADETTHPVAQQKPNAWGLHDMQGNVAEWCNDAYVENYYEQGPEKNPQGPPEMPQSKFILRGGAWNSSAHACRAAYRDSEFPGVLDGCFARDDIGFRCVRRISTTTAATRQGDDP